MVKGSIIRLKIGLRFEAFELSEVSSLCFSLSKSVASEDDLSDDCLETISSSIVDRRF